MTHYNIQLRTEDRVWETVTVQSQDLEALRMELAMFVGELLRDHARQIWVDEEWRVDVTDEAGMILYVMQITASETAATMPIKR